MQLSDEERRIIIGALQDRNTTNRRRDAEQSRTWIIVNDLIDRLRRA